MADKDKNMRLLKRLQSKKDSLFMRAQTLNDMIVGLENEKARNTFLVSARTLDRKAFEALLDEIQDIKLELDPDYTPNYQSLNAFDDLYGNILTAVDKIRALQTVEVKPSSSAYEQSGPSLSRSNLPPLEIKSFSGDIRDWPRFRDLFSSVIIHNSKLTNVERLHYLITTVSGTPADIIKNFPLSGDNFYPAWESLKDRYESDRILASHYFEEFIKPFNIPSKPSVESLQFFLTKVTHNITGLKNMKLTDPADFLFFSLASRQLDPITRKEFESKVDSKNIPTYDSLVTFVKSECRLLEITSAINPLNATSNRKIEPTKSYYSPPSTSKYLSKKSVCTTQFSTPSKFKSNSAAEYKHLKPPIQCKKCGDNHHLYHCQKFLNNTVMDRQFFVKKNLLCVNCLGNHVVNNCKSTINCIYCNGRHHRLLHINKCPPANSVPIIHSNISPPAPDSVSPSTSSAPLTLATVKNNSCHMSKVILLGTASALIKNVKGKFVRFRLLIDCASTASFITQSLVEKLGLPVLPTQEQFSGLSDTPVASGSGVVDCTFKPAGLDRSQVHARAFVVNTILKNVPLTNLPESCKQFVEGLNLADPQFHCSLPVDMLLGCDILHKILVPNAVPPHTSELGVLCTIFGHVLLGPLSVNHVTKQVQSNPSLVTYPRSISPQPENDLHKSVERFWESENISIKSATDPADNYCEQHFIETHSRDSTGRYTVEMPFIRNPDSIDFYESKEIAAQRFYSLENRFRKNSSLKNDCLQFLKEYNSLGHMVKANRPGKYFIPYFCVFNPHSPTTPTRVVFDGSAKKKHMSLNEILYAGPKLHHEVPDVLINFRLQPLVFCCDISKMYRQINIKDDQCVYQHILFRDDPEKPLEEYELRTVTYGLTPSAYCSQRCLIELTRDEGHRFPLAVPIILENSVIDDLFAGAASIDSLLEIKSQLSSLLLAGGFPLNKWLSNSPEFLKTLKDSDPSSSLVIRNADDQSIKILGVGWNPHKDVFFFSLDPPCVQSKYTKRQVLSAVARIYDPLGFAAPVIFLFKCLLKEIWLTGVDWDDPISHTLATQWNMCLSEMNFLSEIKIPRCLFLLEPLSCHLLGFSDGSSKGSAAVLFLRVQYTNHRVKIFLLKAKTRVAPSKGHTIPRLELIGALLLSQLIKSVKPFLAKIPIAYSTHLFCDSTIVLSWIRKPLHQLKLFVSNRISLILENSELSHWYHVSSENNVADCASRGLTPLGLVNNKPWFEGPRWAYAPPEKWPISYLEPLQADLLPEVRSVLVTSNESPNSLPTWLTHCSSLVKLKRIAAYVLRFIHNLKHPLNRHTNLLTASEIHHGLSLCIRLDQSFYFNDEIICLKNKLPVSNKIQNLSPFIDKCGLIRVGGRLKNSQLPYPAKHQILLHNKSHLTYLILAHHHNIYLHAGVRTLQALIMNKFWIINCKSTINKIVYKCVRCSRFRRNSTANPPMGDLPAPRVTPSRPFSNCFVDLAGPFILKESLRRNAKTYKAYFALFVCCAVKAVHLEILTSLSSECFIAAFTRFSSRRGFPAHIYCDQGTNFKGAARQLSEIGEFLRSESTNEIILTHLAHHGVTFHFNVPRAPFMSGLAESNVKNVKFHLTRVVGSQILTLEEFTTVTARVESILNSRPLCAVSNSPDDFASLTPGHFLVGSPLVSIPEYNLTDISIPRLSRWQLVCQISQSLWRRWESEYLHTLQTKSKWFLPSPNVQAGQLVWLHEDNCPPLTYPMARIEQVHPGQDGIVRAVTLRTSTGTYRRPARKVAPLPLA